MAHYAFLDENNIVTEVITGIDENELIEGITPQLWYEQFRGQTCVRTSYNGNIYKNFAGVGYRFDEARQAFIAPQPFASWILNEETCRWEAPLPLPATGNFVWDEASVNWAEVEGE